MRLVDHSLMRKIPGRGGDWRFTMLDTIRDYALDQAARRGELEAVHARFVTHIAELADAADAIVDGDGGTAWLDRLDDELDNLRAALTWTLANDRPTAARIAAGLHRYWLARGPLEEGRQWLHGVLAGAPLPPVVDARVRAATGRLAHRQGDEPAARAELRRAARSLAADLATESSGRAERHAAQSAVSSLARDLGAEHNDLDALIRRL